MQSIYRAIKRKNACVYYSLGTQKLVWKKGTEKNFWRWAMLNSKKED